MATVLVTGGAGYIGSHTCLVLLQAGHTVVVMDNLSNSHPIVLDRVAQLSGRQIEAFYQQDIRDENALSQICQNHTIDVVIHFAALKAVGESVRQPLHYYDNNVSGTLTLCKVLERYGIHNLVFSSSATVYGEPQILPITEDFPLSATNPYGWSKLMMEQVLRDMALANDAWRVVLLRYFNPVGAHPSGHIGEDPQGEPNNLMPYITQVAVGQRDCLSIFGDSYPTADGTGVRDYIHVMDLAEGHKCAVERLAHLPRVACLNLGTGRGYSVLEMVRCFEEASGRAIPFKIVAPRPGDIAECWADPRLAQQQLHWQAVYGLSEMCRDAWHWQLQNPGGYQDQA